MHKKFKFWLTLFALFVCLVNNVGYDRENLFLYFISIPVWVLSPFFDINEMNNIVIYLLTIASWFVLGHIFDLALEKKIKFKGN